MPTIRVAVVGAGIAGLTTALRLLERGYDVTVYDRKSYIGGKLGAHTHGPEDWNNNKPFLSGQAHRPNTYHEHCYHMFMTWYHNFWQLAADVGAPRETHFEARDSIKYLRRGEYPRTMTLRNAVSPEAEWANLTSGVRSFPDMVLSHYSVFDVLAQQFQDGLLGSYTVNGFVQSRPYATEGMASLYQDGLAKAFAIPSYLTSARSYQAFLKYSMRLPEPMMWLLKNDVERGLNAPFKAKLDSLGCHWRTGEYLDHVHIDMPDGPEGPTALPRGRTIVLGSSKAPNEEWPHPSPDVDYKRAFELASPLINAPGLSFSAPSSLFPDAPVFPGLPGLPDAPTEPVDHLDWDVYDYVVLAVPPANLRQYFQDADFTRYFETERNGAIQKLHTEPLASIDIYLNKKLPDMPREHVVLLDSQYGLTVIDHAQLWPGIEGTALNVAATDFRSLADLREEDALTYLIKDLQAFLPINTTDIAYAHIQTNPGDKLFVNEVGSERWRPGPKTKIPHLFLAGDYCKTFIDVVTVEGAVVSGLQAVRALQEQVAADFGDAIAGTKLLGTVKIVEPESYPQWMMAVATVMLAPYAAAAKVWSWTNDHVLGEQPRGLDPQTVLQNATDLAWMPWQVTEAMWATAWSACASFWERPTSSDSSAQGPDAATRS